MKHLDLFTGVGGFTLAAQRVWGEEYELTACCEIDKFCQKVIRENFGDVPIIDDICNLKGDGFGSIGLVTGGFPCQPFSQAGQRKGNEDERALFPEMLRVIREAKPRWIVAENVNGILSIHDGEYFEEICTSLEDEGYSVQPYIIPASAVNAPHERKRVWIVANSIESRTGRNSRKIDNERGDACEDWRTDIRQTHGEISTGGIKSANKNVTETDSYRPQEPRTQQQTGGNRQPVQTTSNSDKLNGNNGGFCSGKISQQQTSELQGFDFADTMRSGCEEQHPPKITKRPGHGTWVLNPEWERTWYEVATELCRMDARVSSRVDRLKGLGNAIVPQVAEVIFRAIKEFDENKQRGK